jgi:hypothetical protein
MERAYFGPHRRAVAVISQGMWYDENDDPASAIAALRLGLDLGMKHIKICGQVKDLWSKD